MKIAIAGSGAMGCRFGSMLFESGNEVLLVDKWQEHINTINQQGLEIINEQGKRNLKIPASLPNQSKEFVDLLIVFTKAMETDTMVNSCQNLIGSETRILTLQNGLGNIETIEKYCPRNRILAGVTTFGTELLGPGKIQALGSGHVQMMQVDSQISSKTTSIANVLNEAGLNVELSSNALTSIWSKVAFNAVLNTLCTLMKSSVGTVGSYSNIEDVIISIVDEIILVAQAEGVQLDRSSIVKMIIDVFDPAMAGNHLPSMLQDMENGRKTEIDYLNGAIVKKAKIYGIKVPTNLLIYHLICMMEEIR